MISKLIPYFALTSNKLVDIANTITTTVRKKHEKRTQDLIKKIGLTPLPIEDLIKSFSQLKIEIKNIEEPESKVKKMIELIKLDDEINETWKQVEERFGCEIQVELVDQESAPTGGQCIYKIIKNFEKVTEPRIQISEESSYTDILRDLIFELYNLKQVSSAEYLDFGRKATMKELTLKEYAIQGEIWEYEVSDHVIELLNQLVQRNPKIVDGFRSLFGSNQDRIDHTYYHPSLHDKESRQRVFRHLLDRIAKVKRLEQLGFFNFKNE